MIFKAVLVFTLFGVILETRGACINCGLGPGKDVCSQQHCAQMIVRPVKLPKIDPSALCKPRTVCQQIVGIPPYRPVGDLCCANKAIVTPAHVPKPPCALCQSGLASSMASASVGPSDPSVVIGIHSAASSASSSSSSSSSSGYVTVIDGYGAPTGQVVAPGYMPADPVSLELAYNMQNKLNKAYEDRLSFGFRTIPKDVVIPKTVKQVFPEENLYGMNGQVVELKVVGGPAQDPSIDEEAIEALIQAEEDELEAASHIKKLTYNEIGFGPAKSNDVQYIKIEGQADTGSSGSAASSCVAGHACNDGYVSGSVIVEPVKKHQICFETVADPHYGVDPADEDDADDDDEDDDSEVIYTSGGLVRAPCYHCSSCKSSSCSSCCSKSRHNIIVESLRCS